ncbi:hypothetical protein N7475_005076 [Penicillium sp. IBT 31633x]|nr:hypothetical protein N7475_005076 [Penicillium sp. IBT 31633x]
MALSRRYARSESIPEAIYYHLIYLSRLDLKFTTGNVLEGLPTRLRKSNLRKDRENDKSIDTPGKKRSQPLVSKASYSIGGPYRILIEFKFKYIKGFLRSKDENIYILPEIIFNPLLILSPYIFLLGLLFTDCAFKKVNGKEVLISIRCNKLLLLLDLALDDVPLPVLIAFDIGLEKRAISDLLYNLIIYHADSRTFLKYYLDR